MGDRKTKAIAAWMIAGWLSITVVMVSALAAIGAGVFPAIFAPVLGACLGAFVLIGCAEAEISSMPAALVWVTCAATVTGLLVFALLGEVGCG